MLTLRAIKAALLLAKTEEGAGGNITAQKELQVLQKLLKQRKEAAEIYTQNNRKDLADLELQEAAVIEPYLPSMMGEDEIKNELKKIIEQTGAKMPSDMGKVMGVATKQFAGHADNKTVAALVKELLSQK